MITLATYTGARGRVTLRVEAPDAYDPADTRPVVLARDTLDRGPMRPYGFRRYAPVDALPDPLPELSALHYARDRETAAAYLSEHGPAIVASIVATWEAGN